MVFDRCPTWLLHVTVGGGLSHSSLTAASTIHYDVVEAHARVLNVTGYLVSNHVAVAMEQKNTL